MEFKENCQDLIPAYRRPARQLCVKHSQICFMTSVSRPQGNIMVWTTELEHWYLSASVGLQLFFLLFRIQESCVTKIPCLTIDRAWLNPTALALGRSWFPARNISRQVPGKWHFSRWHRNVKGPCLWGWCVQLWMRTSAEVGEMLFHSFHVAWETLKVPFEKDVGSLCVTSFPLQICSRCIWITSFLPEFRLCFCGQALEFAHWSAKLTELTAESFQCRRDPTHPSPVFPAPSYFAHLCQTEGLSK